MDTLRACPRGESGKTRGREGMRDLCLPKSRLEPLRCALSRVGPALWLGLGLTLGLVAVSVFAPLLVRYPPDVVIPGAGLQPPSAEHPFGTDALGRDMLSRTLYGGRPALTGALLGVGTAALLGIPLGLAAGYGSGWADRLISRVVEIWLGFPPLLLAIIIVARAGPSLAHAVIALGIVSMPSFFRVTRSCAIKIRQMGYTEAARALGAGHLRIVVRHLLPNVASSLVVLITMRMGRFVLAGGALTFIGLGAQPPTPEWGALLATGRDYLRTAPWLAIFPGLATMIAVLGFNLLGEGLRDLLEVRDRQPPRVSGGNST